MPGRSLCTRRKLPWEEKGPVAFASEHLYTFNVGPGKTMRWRINSFREILRSASKEGRRTQDFELLSRETKSSRSSRRKLSPKLRPARCSSEGRPAILLVRGARKARGLSAVFAASKANARGSRQSAKAYGGIKKIGLFGCYTCRWCLKRFAWQALIGD